MFELEHPEIDLYGSVDSTLRGDGVVTIPDSLPLWIGIALLTVSFFVILLTFFLRMWALHESVLKSATRMSRIETRRAVGSAAYRLAERAQIIEKNVSDDVVIKTMHNLYDLLHQFGLRRVMLGMEISRLIRDIRRILDEMPRSKSVKDSVRSELFTKSLTEFVEVTRRVTPRTEAQAVIDFATSTCVRVIESTSKTASEEAIIKVLQKARPTLEKAKLRCTADADRPLQKKRDDVAPPPQERPVGDVQRVIYEVQEAISRLPTPRSANDPAQRLDQLARDLREWVEVTTSLAYAPWWSVETHIWFFFSLFRRG